MQGELLGASVAPRTVKAISLWQPWASAIALGNKQFETRHWTASYRGLLLIHAAKKWTLDQRDFAMTERALGRLPARIPRGCIVAVCRLVRIHRTADVVQSVSAIERLYGDYSPGRFAWELADVVSLGDKPVECQGHQGFFDLTTDGMPMHLLAAIADCESRQLGQQE